jgi:hypothetical protein
MAAPAKALSSMSRRASDRITSPSVADVVVRTPEKSFRTDSHPSAPALDEIRAGSHVVRIDAKHVFLADINETKNHLRLTVEVMAINAGCPVSSMSDALAGKEGRNFAGHWLIAQGDEFIDAFVAIRNARLGRTPAASKSASVIVEVVRQLAEKLA